MGHSPLKGQHKHATGSRSKKLVACRSGTAHTHPNRLPLEDRHTILFDCKSVEGMVNLHDFLETQFDGYLRKERESGMTPLAFMVIGPAFTPQSIKLAHQYT